MNKNSLKHYLKDDSVTIEMVTIVRGTNYLLPETIVLRSSKSFLDLENSKGILPLKNITTMYNYIDHDGMHEVQFKGTGGKDGEDVYSKRLKVAFLEYINKEEAEYICIAKGELYVTVLNIKKIS